MDYFYISFFAVAIASVLAVYFSKIYKTNNPILEKVLKVTVIVWMSVYFVNLFLPDSFAMRTFDDLSPYVGGENIWFAIIRWCNDLAFIVLPVSVFYKNKLFNRITAFFLLAVCVLNVSVYFKYLEVYTSTAGAGIMALRFFSEGTKAFFINPVFRSIYFGLSNYLELMIIVIVTLRSAKDLKFEIKTKNIFKGLGVFLLLFLSIMPIYVPQYLFKGYSLITEDVFTTFKMGKPFHILWMIFVIIEGVVLTILFKKKSYETRFIVVLVLALSLIMQYHQMFTGIGEITAHRMPFQLCNMAGFFILLTLLTKNEKIYHFTLVINSVGAIIAMVMCDTTPYGISYIMNIHYITEHTNVILAPILCATLRIFAPLKNKDVKHFIIGFTLYFLFILLIGGIFTGLKETTGNDYWNCNYLFVFNRAETVNILGFVGPLFDVKFTLFNFFTLSLVQFVVYVVFLGICTGAFFLMKLLLNRKNEVRSANDCESND